MVLEARGIVTLDAPGGNPGAPRLPPDKRRLTLASLLTHRSGLPALRPFHKIVEAAPEAQRPGLLPELAAAEPLEYAPALPTSTATWALCSSRSWWRRPAAGVWKVFASQELYEPLGLDLLGFRPLTRLDQGKFTWAATDETNTPGIPPVGVVHDENARAAGGVAGHAGLFGTAADVFTLVAWLYRAYHGHCEGLSIPPENSAPVPDPGRPGRTHPPGLMCPVRGKAPAGRYFPPRSVGHTGFTGTSLWLDLEQGQMVVLLTNRVRLGPGTRRSSRPTAPRFHEAAPGSGGDMGLCGEGG